MEILFISKMLEINKIHQGDCLELMKKLDDESIDLIVTDPPYCVLGTNQGYRQEWDTFKNLDEYFGFTKKWAEEIYRVLKQDSQCYVFFSQKYIYNFYKIIEKTKFEVKRLLIWFHPNLSKPTNKMWLWKYDPIFFLTKGKIKKFNCSFNKNENCDVLKFAKPQSNFKKDFRYHPTSKPLELVKLLVKISSNEGNIVLDPFIGSGTTAVACKQLGRNFIGIELSPEYCKIANERLKINKNINLLQF